ncbi:MAG: hypothetical protein EHM40_15915 [Chloroflexi bacterium]|nr:MAG: hypothetical protein EHM40_15915 [Chloroflexota bacterium]
MKSVKSATFTIINALLWATAMLAASIVLAGTGYAEKIVYILFTLWLGSFLTLPGSHESMKSECAWIRKLFRSTPKNE